MLAAVDKHALLRRHLDLDQCGNELDARHDCAHERELAGGGDLRRWHRDWWPTATAPRVDVHEFGDVVADDRAQHRLVFHGEFHRRQPADRLQRFGYLYLHQFWEIVDQGNQRAGRRPMAVGGSSADGVYWVRP